MAIVGFSQVLQQSSRDEWLWSGDRYSLQERFDGIPMESGRRLGFYDITKGSRHRYTLGTDQLN